MLGKDGRMYPDRKGMNSPSWRGGRQKTGNGYMQVVAHGHPRADSRGRVLEHVLRAEKALGKLLPDKAVVHHVFTHEKDKPTQHLVICQDQAYHLLLHRRQRAHEACGHVDWLRCRHCREWDEPINLKVFERKKEGVDAYHKHCHALAERERLAGKK